jgi:serum/glucocorticoid-regulated kinase 2
MSWKLTKKLKETHLAPLANTFSRSSSTSTIVDDQKTPSSTSSTSTLVNPKDPNGIGTPVPHVLRASRRWPFAAASEAAAAAPSTPVRPGILIVTLHEGKGFSLPAGHENTFAQSGHHQGSLSQGGGLSVAGSVRPGSSSRNPGVGSYANRPQSAAGSINAAPTIHGRYSSKHLPYALVDFDKQQVFINAVSGTPENPLWAGGNTQYKFDVSRTTDLAVSLYIRNPTAPPTAGRSQDICIGTLNINPRFEEARTDEKSKDGHAAGQAGAEWIKISFGTGEFRIGVNFVENRQDRLSIDDFELLKVVGKGSFGKVMQVQ